MNTGTVKCVTLRVVSAAMTEWDPACGDEGRRTMFDIEHKKHLHGVPAQYSLILDRYKKKNVQNLIISTQDGFKKVNLQTLK